MHLPGTPASRVLQPLPALGVDKPSRFGRIAELMEADDSEEDEGGARGRGRAEEHEEVSLMARGHGREDRRGAEQGARARVCPLWSVGAHVFCVEACACVCSVWGHVRVRVFCVGAYARVHCR